MAQDVNRYDINGRDGIDGIDGQNRRDGRDGRDGRDEKYGDETEVERREARGERQLD